MDESATAVRKAATPEQQDPATQAAHFARALADQLEPWNQAVAEPAHAQEAVLRRLLRDYDLTSYGTDHGAAAVAATSETPGALVAEYRRAFPVMTYDDYKPLIEEVMAGDTDLLLCGGARRLGHHARHHGGRVQVHPHDPHRPPHAGERGTGHDGLRGGHQALRPLRRRQPQPQLPLASWARCTVGDSEIEYGYSSGIYTKHVSKFTPIRSVPSQEEIDQLSPGTTRAEWDARFELAIEKCRHENVTLVGGVCQTALEFGRYLRRRHKVYPKELWKTQIMTLGSTPGINTRHAAQLTAMYGPVAIREIYGATEGMFGQQRDDRRAWVPNYDLFFFEVLTRHGHQDAARDEARRDRQPGGLDPHPGPLPHRRHDPGAEAALLPLHRPGQVVDQA